MLKVLHIYRTYFPDPPGGSQEAIKQIARATQRHSVESRIFTLSPTPEPTEVVLSEGRVVRSRSYAAPASCDIGGLESLTHFKRQANWADVLNFHFPWPFGDVLRLLGNRSKPAVLTYHSDIVRQRFLGALYYPLMRRMLNSMDAIIPTSDTYARTSPVLRHSVHPSKLHVIPLGIADFSLQLSDESENVSSYARFGISSGEPFLLFLGVHRYYKGLHTLVRAASGIAAKIVIAGSGPESERLAILARELGAANVSLPGQISDAEKVFLLRHCSAFVLPSHLRSEAFGMVLVEAAMFGKPMITCEIGSGTSFVNENEITGFVIPPESVESLQLSANRLLADAALRERMGVAARERYHQLFSDIALGHAYSHLYHSVATNGVAVRGRTSY